MTRSTALTISLLYALFLVGLPATALADGDPPYECDNTFNDCGTPETSGGGGSGGGGSILVNNTDLGDSYQFADDYDDDGIEDNSDNCPRTRNVGQADADGDGVGDSCDNCLQVANADQSDLDGNGAGDLCDDDQDGDNVPDVDDNCPAFPNPADAAGVQADLDNNGAGDACDDDIDGDGKPNLDDGCPMNRSISEPSADQVSQCFPDSDGDKKIDIEDNCVTIQNENQHDVDDDHTGDACDPDIDGDTVQNPADNCPMVANGAQVDADRDGHGDACDPSFCYVVMGDEANCLDPLDQLTIYSPSLVVPTGQRARLRLFANRHNQAMRYTYEVIDAPEDSAAAVSRPQGSTTVSTPFEYRFMKDEEPTFRADQPGAYTIRVVAQTVFDDQQSGLLHEQSEYELTVTANGDPVDLDGGVADDPIGCDSSDQGAPMSLAALLLVLGTAVIERRRRPSC